MPRSSPHLLAPLLLLAACDPGADRGPASRAEESLSTGTGSVTGVVRYLGPDPDRPVSMDEPLCRSLHPEPVDSGVVQRGPEGGLANVLVFIDWRSGDGTKLAGGRVPERPVTVRHEGCLIAPRVAAAMVGQGVRFVNRDPTLHSLRLLAEDNRDVARDLPFRNQALEVELERPEVAVAVRCAVHPWARGWLAALPHRHATVTGPDGEFVVGGLPPGTYTVVFWHELLGTESRTVRVSRGGSERLVLTFE